ncbi:MAG: methylcobamide--CoM methyltransferase MtbA [Methanomicrobiales archaeon HGW-Methanomicrobiales-3]|jgi:uroporphyrinogen decarboxylase|nr:MAG: methylcobamide--CoM methyltransferase MtbA [Methanomicrobiales archaeon HGW-Methanomicrobiales-3]
MTDIMTPFERTMTAIGQKEPDRVPLFLLTTMHGAKELNLSIREYYSRAENVIRGQTILQKKYDSDCYYPFFYASAEVEAWGGDVIYITDGPPNAGRPIIRSPQDIVSIDVPEVASCESLKKITDCIRGLAAQSAGKIPVVGVVMSPFSVPVMQMGFEPYLDLMYTQKDLFWELMKKNQQFCIDWANAQLEAGAHAICYFDPVSSPTSVPPELYRKTGMVVAKETIARIKGPTATHLASGRALAIIDDLATTGTAIVGTSALENIGEVKQACNKRLTVLGNLNGIEMRRWTPEIAEARVRETIARAGKGGGFILSDNHGEIPWQVPDRVLMAISSAVKKYGTYPLAE